MSKKIKVTLPQNIYEIIKNDIDDFNMTSNHFMNYIFLNLNEKYKNFKGNPTIAEQSKEKSSIQFNLNKESSLIYYDVLRDNNAQNESEFMRSLLIRYATNPKNKRELFSEYMVITNEKLYKRFEKEVISGIEQANNDFIKKLRENYSFSFNVDEEIKMINFSKPSLFITGRQDNTVGYYDLYNLLEDYPRATFAILDTAGHNLQIEQEEVFNSLFLNWLKRVEKYKI